MNNQPSNKHLSLSDALSFGFKRFVDHILFIIGLGLLLAALVSSIALSGILVGALAKGSMLGFQEVLACLPDMKHCISQFLIPIIFVASLLAMIVFAWLHLGYIKVMFDLHDNNTALLSTLFSQGRKIIYYIVGMFLYVLMIAVGLVLLIIPGIYVWYRFGFYSYSIVDRNIGPIDALKYSWNLTKSHNMFTLGLWVIFALLTRFAGALAFLTGGIGYITLINGYRQLQNQVQITHNSRI